MPNVSTPTAPVLLSVVTPLFNEEQACALLFERLLPVLHSITDDFEVVCIDDGSHDGTLASLSRQHALEPRIKVVSLTRNFGKDVALMAGLDYSQGAAVVLLDADLQDPPELIPQMVERWREGFDTVICVRSERPGDSRRKRWLASLFYRIMGHVSAVDVPANAGDFRLLDRKLVGALQQLPERSRFMKGLYAWVGSQPAYVYFERPERSAGVSKWRYWHLWNFALDGIFSFTTLPLRIWTYMGLLVCVVSAAGAAVLVMQMFGGAEQQAYPITLVAVLFFSGVNMIGLGVLGEYIGRIFLEVKQRPQYLVGREIGFTDGQREPRTL